MIRDGAADGELTEVHHCPTQKQEQWKPGPGEDQAYSRNEDRSDVCRMENGANHPSPLQPLFQYLQNYFHQHLNLQSLRSLPL